jgi:transposase-like protein
MALMTVNNHEPGKDHRSQPRWSAGKKTEGVLRLLRGESLEELSRELKVEAHRLAAWRDDFLAAGRQGLKGQRPDRSPVDRALKQAERMLRWAITCTNGCSCWSPDEENSPRFFLAMDALYRLS